MPVSSSLRHGVVLALGIAIGTTLSPQPGAPPRPGKEEGGAAEHGSLATPAATPGTVEAAAPRRLGVVARGLVDADGGLVQIAASRDGVVRSVAADEGDRVRKGETLLVIDDRAARSELAVAEAELAQAAAALEAIGVRRNAAAREVVRYRRLVSTNAAAQIRLDEYLDQLRLADADLELQQAAINTARARRDAAATEVVERTVQAPVDGVVLRRQVRAGDGVSTLNVTTLFWLAPATRLVVRAEVEELGAEAVGVGEPAEVVVEDDALRRYPARVAQVGQAFIPRRSTLYDPRERADVRVVEAIVHFDNPPPLRLGQRVIVRFRGMSAPPAE